ncbi:MAG: hypothetical protein ND895_17260 [Pyrinomonadaceae bacterium]|nr:hypothetical protein [Pyrinomonadaceae bacterium]
MKHLRTLCASVLLTAAFTVPVCAGNITTGVVQPPPPGSSPNGNITTGKPENSRSLREIAAQLLQFIAVHQVNLY